MRLTIKEPEIKLYEDGFDKHDKLKRVETGQKLSTLVENIHEPLVIALDGAWGSGKTHFLKCWVGEHLKREANTTQTVYFDAFQHDFLDDPLIALTGAISDRIDSEGRDPPEQRKERTAKIRKAGFAITKGLARIGAAAVTHGATEKILSDMGDEVAKAVGKEAETFLNSDIGSEEARTFWSEQHARLAAMEAFRMALVELTEPLEKELPPGTPTRKLVIVVDELDRCRPDYALSLLEIIKHFFSVDGVHFVLGVNLYELQNSVRARYGQGIEANTYLQKFVTLQMHLPNKIFDREVTLEYFDYAAAEVGLGRNLHDAAQDFLQNANDELSLRSVRRFLTILVLLPNTANNLRRGYLATVMTGAYLKCFRPDLYPKFRSGRIVTREIQVAVALDSEINAVFQFILDPENISDVKLKLAEKTFGGSSPRGHASFLRYICETYLDAYQILPRS